MAKAIGSIYVAVALPRNLCDETVDCIKEMVRVKDAEYLLVKNPGKTILLMKKRRSGKLFFNSGMKTIQSMLGGIPVERLEIPRPAPAGILNDIFPGGYHAPDVIQWMGDVFSPKSIKKSIDLFRNQEKMIISNDMPLRQLVGRSYIKLTELPLVASAREHLNFEDKMTAFMEKEELKGKHVLTFRPHDNDGVPIPDGKETEVAIVGRPGQTKRERKHYWIYYRTGNYYGGIHEIVQKYKSAIISHASNAMGMPEYAQFLIFEEFSPTQKLDLSQLKRLTGGDASSCFFNRKSSGILRKDAQFIVTGNNSPYETYAVRDKGTGAKFLSRDALSAIEARFQIIRLDGDDSEEKIKHVHVSLLSEDEYLRNLRNTFYQPITRCLNLNALTTISVKNALLRCMQVYKCRYAGEECNLMCLMMDLAKIIPDEDLMVINQIIEQYDVFHPIGDMNKKVRLIGHLTPYQKITVADQGIVIHEEECVHIDE